jgi:tripartite-type tricarboxylate transporter receptor subunit TctC
MMRYALLRCGLAAALALCVGANVRADDFPSRQITIMVGLAAGGITDMTARLYAEVVARNIGQRIIIDNRPTAGGAVAAAAVQNAAPDGYTLLVFSGSQLATVAALQGAPYDPVKGFQPVTLLFNLATLLVVPTESPAKSVAELLELGKKKAGGLLFGSPGVGSPSHLLAARIGIATSTPMQFVHYRGGAPMMADLITGRVDFGLGSYASAGAQVADRKLRVLAIDADVRWNKMPEVPTLTEVGLGNEKVANWFALAAPAGTPMTVVQKLRDEFIKASRDPDLMRRLADSASPIITSTPQELGKLMADEAASMEQLVKTLGLKTQ